MAIPGEVMRRAGEPGPESPGGQAGGQAGGRGPADVGEGKRFLGEVQFQEEIFIAEFIAEIRPPDHVEASAAPGALRLLGGLASDKTAKRSKKVNRGGKFRHGSCGMGLIKREIGFDRHRVTSPFPIIK